MAPRHTDAEIGPIDQLHDNEAVRAVFHEIVDRNDMLMRQSTDGLDLASHALPCDVGDRGRRHQEFDGDVGPEVAIPGREHDGVSAATDLTQDLIAAGEHRPDREIRSRGGHAVSC